MKTHTGDTNSPKAKMFPETKTSNTITVNDLSLKFHRNMNTKKEFPTKMDSARTL